MKSYDVAIIGCGITGAAAAFALSRFKVSLVVLEAENDVADSTTKANSGILHAGYDPPAGSLMAKLNVRGVELGKKLCKDLDVPVRWCGSLVVALSEGQKASVQTLYARGIANGVSGMQLLSASQTRNFEPNISPDAACALYAPTAGVVYPWEYALAFIETAVRNGTELQRNFHVTAIQRSESGYRITSSSGESVSARYVINAAGLYADQIHNMVAEPSFKLLPSKGEYYLLDKNQAGLVKHVVFQCPDKNGKGTLVAPTAGGNIIVGPNAAASAKEDVSVTQEGLDYVAAQAKKSVPSLDVRSSIRNFAGMRANNDRGDFIIEEAADAPGFIDLAGIKSPGLTSAPAIGERCLMLLEHSGLALQEKSEYCTTRTRVKFNELSVKEKQEIISKNPLYGRIICRCETVTEGEIIDALRSPVPPVSIDGIKRRCGAGMGRCQGGFCSPRVMEILMNERHVSWKDIIQDKAGSYMLTGRTKTQGSL